MLGWYYNVVNVVKGGNYDMGLFDIFKKSKDEYNNIYGETDVANTSEVYEDVYDEEGNFVYCDYCNSLLTYKDGIYICRDCGQTFSRSEFMNFIGAEPPGPECATCSNQYPGCIVCPYGYVNDEY